MADQFLGNGIGSLHDMTFLMADTVVILKGLGAGFTTGAANFKSGTQALKSSFLIDLVGMYPTAVMMMLEMSNHYAQRTLCMDDMPTLLPLSVPSNLA
ncbi:uncharacterized protein PHACADRAFT_192541 [Phanerochaete carnosa HHB-10118-sp]|uniref:Uncharacterized protein n=1 Tax=Phanerochaete carnosa (strain HHB-10118-sp) TaxID=650164 RepID=K5XB23_PHACS|nr:uncharacterized protein PHACADRAFT_192541 [Phanerochaete carnosa HHB-10118-sp]EKM60142.1 hypothetical protein PHACADRAFT_192541 [Phanerochaete carnosa HHB-10118-sp]